ncbi:hypothetical protein MKW98_016881 [Papaver atlanticum]|uniref:DDE Tnp4 domain-containing protein n=1 Tax=Papaver atlanticum TaxID=357466 RepID=A0AAD4XZ87_9MAGN|nr:hypothetical protein MKW98_016881 [Papaver atlanticum]
MTPYRNTRYWLRDFRRGGRPRTKKEKFNQAHSQLRNVIERAFGVLKARFPILDKMRRFSFTTQKYLVVATMAIHNFPRHIRLNDELFRRFEDVGLEVSNTIEMNSESATSATQHVFRPQDQTFMHQLRDQVANELDLLVGV